MERITAFDILIACSCANPDGGLRNDPGKWLIIMQNA